MAAQAGWYVDPKDAHQYRYWDGERWSQSTQPIPNEALSPVGEVAAHSSLTAGGGAAPVGSGAFDPTATAAAAAPAAAGADGVLADFMWTSGFGEDGTAPVSSGNTMFSPDAGAAPPVAPYTPPEPPAPAPAPAPVPSAPAFVPLPPAAGPAGAAPGNPYGPSGAPTPPAAGAAPAPPPPAWGAAAAPFPVPPQEDASPPGKRRKGRKVEQYTMGEEAAGVPTSRRGRKGGKPFPEAVPVAAAAAGGAVAGSVAGEAGGAVADPFAGAEPTESVGAARRRRKAKAAEGDTPPDEPTPKPVAKVDNKPKSKLPLLLGVLGVVVLGAGAYLVFGGSDDPPPAADGGTPTSVETSDATDAEDTTTDVAETSTPVASVAPTTVAPVATVAPDVAAGLNDQFNTEVTRACDAIKADPGLPTETVIVFSDEWVAVGKNYESLQKAVNECAFQARDEALKRVAEAGG